MLRPAEGRDPATHPLLRATDDDAQAPSTPADRSPCLDTHIGAKDL